MKMLKVPREVFDALSREVAACWRYSTVWDGKKQVERRPDPKPLRILLHGEEEDLLIVPGPLEYTKEEL